MLYTFWSKLKNILLYIINKMNIENVKRISNIYNKKKLIEIFTDLTENEITEIFNELWKKYYIQ